MKSKRVRKNFKYKIVKQNIWGVILSFLDKVKKVAAEVGKKALEEAKKKAAEAQLRREKAQLLDFLTKKELISLALDYEIPISKGMTKDKIIYALSKSKRLTKRAIKNYIRKKEGIEPIIKDAKIKETEEIEVEQEIIRTEKIKTKVRKVSTIERKIERELKKFRPIGRIKSERELEIALAGSLSRAFGAENVQRQVRMRYGKVDMVIQHEYAIELKMPSSFSEIIRSEGPIRRYADNFKKVYFFIYDVRKVLSPTEKKELQRDLPSNVEVIIK